MLKGAHIYFLLSLISWGLIGSLNVIINLFQPMKNINEALAKNLIKLLD
jgi:hypothetical protein